MPTSVALWSRYGITVGLCYLEVLLFICLCYCFYPSLTYFCCYFTGYNNIINFTGVGIIWFILHVVGLSGSELVVNLDVGFFGPKSPFITVGKAGLDVRMVDPNISFMVLLV